MIKCLCAALLTILILFAACSPTGGNNEMSENGNVPGNSTDTSNPADESASSASDTETAETIDLYVVREDKHLTKLGYTMESVQSIINVKKLSASSADDVISLLPVPRFRKYESYTFDNDILTLVYEIDETDVITEGNGLDPFPDTVLENNALLLFAAFEYLEKVTYLYINTSFTDEVSYTIRDLEERFGQIEPPEMDFVDLYDALADNIQLSEFYFAHNMKIYLETSAYEIEMRNGEPGRTVEFDDDTFAFVYPGLGRFYFYTAENDENQTFTGLFATSYYVTDGEYYGDIVEYLGEPDVDIAMTDKSTYIAYELREGYDSYAYYLLGEDDRVFAQGVMYGNDYELFSKGDV